MPFKIVRNDITQMQTEAIVNTANDRPAVGTGCDYAVYKAAGYEELLSYREEKIGFVKEGDVFITPGFKLPSKYIIHAVSPLYIDGEHGEEDLLRSCYRKTLALAEEYGIQSIAFPLISTGGFGYPKEEGMRIAVDEIHAFLLRSEMQVYLVVFDEKATRMGRNLYPDLEAYIDRNYVQEKRAEEYGDGYHASSMAREDGAGAAYASPQADRRERPRNRRLSERRKGAERPNFDFTAAPESLPTAKPTAKPAGKPGGKKQGRISSLFGRNKEAAAHGFWKEDTEEAAALPSMDAFSAEDAAIGEMERKLAERMEHMSDTFPQYLLYLIKEKGLTNADVYKRAIVDKKVFSKIKTNPDYHPQKLTALCLCVGAMLNMDESRDLLARAGYALSPCDKTDIIFSYFIENGIYDMIELDIQLEEHGLPCIIT